ncbi:MAG: hypothetical protein RLZZ582_663 [Verrucomicrobiota bacterium]|jgi:hypothetical protein
MKVLASNWMGFLLAWIAFGSGLTHAAETNQPTVLDSKALARRVAERNIFDPDRQPRTRGESRPIPKPVVAVAADAPEMGLVGVMTFQKGTFAFFDGNAAEYRKTLQLQALIAGHTVTAITPQSVTLSESNGPTVLLKVGQRLRKDAEGVWKLAAGGTGEAFTRSSGSVGAGSGAASSSSSSSATSTTEDPPGSDEILKRLLKKREQEMK